MYIRVHTYVCTYVHVYTYIILVILAALFCSSGASQTRLSNYTRCAAPSVPFVINFYVSIACQIAACVSLCCILIK